MEKDIQRLTQNERYDLKRKQLKEEWNEMTKEITQEERLDLTTDKIKAEKLAYSIELFKSLEAIRKGKEIFICDLKAENERLKKQLNDYEKALKEYADGYNYAYVDNGFAFYSNNYSNEGLAQEALEKWENK